MASLTNFSLTPLQGGSNGTVPTTWANYFDALRTADIPYAYYVVPLTPSQTIHEELSSVVTELSISGYPLRAIVGGQLGETLQFTLALFRGQNSVTPSLRCLILRPGASILIA